MIFRRSLMIFTRYPEAGKSKTRLVPALGPDGAAGLQRLMTEMIVGRAARVAAVLGVAVEVHHAGGSDQQMQAWLGRYRYVAQEKGDLGKRMATAFARSFAREVDAAVLVGSDVPGVDAAILHDSFKLLEDTQVVLGPSEDGGYYLIGMRRERALSLIPLLFEKMRWSTGSVCAETLARLDIAGIPVASLPVLHDVDCPEDLGVARDAGLL